MSEAGELVDAVTLPAYAGLTLAQVTMVTSRAQAAAARAVLEQADALGFDTESRPTFIRGQESGGPHLVQLATDTHCYLYQVDHIAALDDLAALLASPRLVKAGFGLGAGGDHGHLRQGQPGIGRQRDADGDSVGQLARLVHAAPASAATAASTARSWWMS